MSAGMSGVSGSSTNFANDATGRPRCCNVCMEQLYPPRDWSDVNVRYVGMRGCCCYCFDSTFIFGSCSPFFSSSLSLIIFSSLSLLSLSSSLFSSSLSLCSHF